LTFDIYRVKFDENLIRTGCAELDNVYCM